MLQKIKTHAINDTLYNYFAMYFGNHINVEEHVYRCCYVMIFMEDFILFFTDSSNFIHVLLFIDYSFNSIPNIR